MRILVTGGAGYIGCQVVLRLCEQGHRVTTFDNLSSGHRELLPGGTFRLGDIRDAADFAAALSQSGAEAVFHLAALSDVRESMRDADKYHDHNVAGTRNVVEGCIAAGVRRLVFSSSAAVYGLAGAAPVSEASALQPISPYGETKLRAEQILADAAATGLNYVALRFFNVAGADPGGRCGESAAEAWHLITLACRAALGLRPGLTINGADYPTADGTCVRDYVHVDDVARAHLKALDYLAGGGPAQCLNVGYGRGASVRQIVDLARKVSECDFPVDIGPPLAGDPPYLVAATDEIRRVLGWSPRHDDLEAIVRSALAWEKKISARGGLRA